jgi:threonine dehydratase
VLFRSLTVVLPETAAPNKRAKIAALGPEIVLCGAESGAAERHARKLAMDRGLTYVSPYNDPEVMAGQGTIGIELLSQFPELDCVVVALGGGGLVGGIGAALKAARPGIRVVGASAANSPALAVALEEGRIRPVAHLDTLADGVSGDMDEDSITFPVCQAVVDEVVTCTEAEIAAAFRRMAYEEHQIVEGAAALALAAALRSVEALRGRHVAVVLCGANIAPEKARALLAES